MKRLFDLNNFNPQGLLNEIWEYNEVYLQDLNNWNNHRLLLLLGLALTKDDVIEMGSGDGSTAMLENRCDYDSRVFKSYDSSKEWAAKTGATWIEGWDKANIWHPCDLLFIDHAPGEHRKVAIERMMDRADIIVVHDTEHGGAGDYGFEPVFAKFKYRLNYNKTGGGAGATMVSNKIDLNQFRGLSLGEYTFDND